MSEQQKSALRDEVTLKVTTIRTMTQNDYLRYKSVGIFPTAVFEEVDENGMGTFVTPDGAQTVVEIIKPEEVEESLE